MTFLVDTFSGSAGTFLTAHTSDSGAAYTNVIGSNVLDGVGGVYANSMGPPCATASNATAGVPITITWDVEIYSDGPNLAGAAIFDASGSYYDLVSVTSALVAPVGGGWVLERHNATDTDAAILSAATGVPAPTVGLTYNVSLTYAISGGNVSLSWSVKQSGTTIWSSTYTDSSANKYTDCDAPGVRTYYLTAGSASTGHHTRNLAATGTASPATAYTLSGPSVNLGVRGNPSGTYTISPNGTYTGTISVAVLGAGLNTTLNFSFSSNTPQTFTITPTTFGCTSLTPTSSPQLGTDPLPLSQVSLKKVNVYFGIDSLTYGYGASTGEGTTTGTVYPGVVFTQLQGTQSFYEGVNDGVNGQRLDTALANRAYAAAYDATADVNVACVFGGSSDINGNGPTTPTNASQTYARLIALVADIISVGYVVVVVTITPAGSLLIAGFNTTRDEYVALIRAGAAANKYAVADVAQDSRIGWTGSDTNTTYFQSDQTHLTDAGYAIVAEYVAPLIQELVYPSAGKSFSMTI